jgi:uncharacterized membrane protein
MKASTKLFATVFILLLSTTIFSACTHSTEGIENTKEVCFDTQVLPILQTNCAMSGCHDGGDGEGGDIVFTDYSAVMKNITPKDPKASKIYYAMTDTWGTLMPPSPRSPLSIEQRTLIFLWIQQGAKETKCN